MSDLRPEDSRKRQTLGASIVITGFGRQKVYPPVGRCIYCFASECDLGDEHIIPQALGGNIILQRASCSACERIIGAGLERRLTHKTGGMFASLRLRHGYKSKRPRERPESLPFTIIGKDGSRRIVNIPANRVPRYWVTYVTLSSPGVIIGLDRNAPALGRTITQYNQDDVKALADVLRAGDNIQLQGAGDGRDLARLMAKIAHGMAVAEYGLDSFDPWLPGFILGNDDCTMHYYVAAHENKTVETSGDHRVSLGRWEHDRSVIGATVRLFCCHGSPDYEIAVGRTIAA